MVALPKLVTLPPCEVMLAALIVVSALLLIEPVLLFRLPDWMASVPPLTMPFAVPLLMLVRV